MKVLIIGNYPAAMLVLSSVEHCIINMTHLSVDNDVADIEDYIDLCTMHSTVMSRAINIYNDSPWSHLLNRDPNDRMTRIKHKIYRAIGWKPDLIIYVYDMHPQSEVFNRIYQSGAEIDIPVFSTNCSDNRFVNNLQAIIYEHR